ncbi:MAG: hypothetical protein FWG33_00710 [Oscillospiraceae bacterium]|nr:hypothetical protein [Oscillospiraceae bacterium]
METSALMNIVRVGTVSSVDAASRTARVAFTDKKDSAGNPHISAPLPVLRNVPFIPAQKVPQQTEVSDSHKHDVKISPWLPEVGELVLCLFLPNGESDGFVLGGL